MQRLIVLAVLVLMGSPAWAAAPTTFVWDRNTEVDLEHYELYGCSTSSTCVPGTSTTDRIGADVPQSVIGTRPSMLIPANTEGRAAVLAVDLLGNKSGLSNVVNYDKKAPAVPLNFGAQ